MLAVVKIFFWKLNNVLLTSQSFFINTGITISSMAEFTPPAQCEIEVEAPKQTKSDRVFVSNWFHQKLLRQQQSPSTNELSKTRFSISCWGKTQRDKNYPCVSASSCTQWEAGLSVLHSVRGIHAKRADTQVSPYIRNHHLNRFSTDPPDPS